MREAFAVQNLVIFFQHKILHVYMETTSTSINNVLGSSSAYWHSKLSESFRNDVVSQLCFEQPDPDHYPWILVGWLFWGLTALETVFQSISRKKREMIDERKNVQTTPTLKEITSQTD